LNRDAANAELLRELGWKRIVVWECELKDPDAVAERLISQLTDDNPANEKI
jgi:G:T-mismatch repair DNA endonuclease (very short patch repair protein)